MSYHVQQQPQQKTFGIFIVIAFHVLLILGFINGLKVSLTAPDNTTVRVTNLPQVAPPTSIPAPPVPHISDVTVTIEKPTTVDFSDPVDVLPTSDDSSGIGSGVSNVIPTVKPKLLKATKPDYPIAASRLGEEGKTGLRLFITAEGRVAEATVFSTSGSERLDAAAVKHALRNWAFSPCMENGKAVACYYQANLVWRLEESKR